MELFVMSVENNRREELIENYSSFIWTERYVGSGDLVLEVEPTKENYDRFAPGTYIGASESNRLMKVENRVRSRDREERPKLVVSGSSLESIFHGRAAKMTLTATPWELNGTAAAIVRTIVRNICELGNGISLDDRIIGLTSTNLTIGDGGPALESISVALAAGSIYDRITELCMAYDLGYRIRVVHGSPGYLFEVYRGANRTGASGVTFGESLENLSDTSHLDSIEGAYTGAYIFSKNGSRMVPSSWKGTSLNLERRILLIDATDIDLPAGATLNAVLRERAKDELAKRRPKTLFDGTVDPYGEQRYNTHYFLGDKVAVKGDYGERHEMRVTEQIWAYDAGVLRSYPTLADTSEV